MVSATTSCFLTSGVPGREGLTLAVGVEDSDYPKPAPGPSVPLQYLCKGSTTDPFNPQLFPGPMSVHPLLTSSFLAPIPAAHPAA